MLKFTRASTAKIDGVAKGKSTFLSKYHFEAPYAIAASLIVSGTPLNPSTVNLTTGVPPNIIVIITAATFPVPKN